MSKKTIIDKVVRKISQKDISFSMDDPLGAEKTDTTGMFKNHAKTLLKQLSDIENSISEAKAFLEKVKKTDSLDYKDTELKKVKELQKKCKSFLGSLEDRWGL